MDVITTGIVISVNNNDEFEITSGGCTILCDGEINELPIIGFEIIVEGTVETDALGNDVEIDVDNWAKENTDPPPWPADTVNTVFKANNSPNGSVAILFGIVTSIIDTNTAYGNFDDGTGTIRIDFQSSNAPNVNDSVRVLGIVEIVSPDPKNIDVKYWFQKGGNPPPNPDRLAWDIPQAKSYPIGSYGLLKGVVTQWSNQNDGVGTFSNGAITIGIDFDTSVTTLPKIDDTIKVLGVTFDNGVDPGFSGFVWFDPNTVGFKENSAFIPGIKVFPNPVNELLYIEVEDLSSEAVFSVIDLNGRIVVPMQSFEFSNEFARKQVNIGHLKHGNYFVRVQDGDNVGVYHITKQ